MWPITCKNYKKIAMLKKLFIVASLNRITNLSSMLHDVGKNVSRVSFIHYFTLRTLAAHLWLVSVTEVLGLYTKRLWGHRNEVSSSAHSQVAWWAFLQLRCFGRSYSLVWAFRRDCIAQAQSPTCTLFITLQYYLVVQGLETVQRKSFSNPCLSREEAASSTSR